MDFKVIVTPQANEALRDIVRYIARDNPERAETFGYELCRKTLPLQLHPYLGRIVPEFRRPDIRELIFRSFRIVYGIDEPNQVIYVYHFWHGARGTLELPPELSP